MTLPAAGYFTDPLRNNGEAKQAQDDMLDTLLALPAAVGDVTGPASSTSGNLATFNGTGGKTISDSGIAPGTLLRTTNNLSDLSSASTARSNLEVYSTTQVDSAISSAVSGISGTDQTARDQIALTNLRLLLNSSVTSGALYQGYQWELLTDEWGGDSSDETYVSSYPSYYGNGGSGLTLVPGAAGTAIGTLTSNGGLAGAFDGTTSQSVSECAYLAGASVGTVGKSWGSAKTISGFDIWGANDGGYSYNNTADVTFKLYGSNSGLGVSPVLLYTSASFTDTNASQAKSYTSGINTTTAYLHHWVEINLTSAQGVVVAEVQFYEAASPLNMTLVSHPPVSVASAPSYMNAFFLYKDDSGGAVLGTDLTVELSRDGGATYTAATLTTVATVDGSYSSIKARADVSGQPSGTSMKVRIKTLNNKAQRVAAPALYKE